MPHSPPTIGITLSARADRDEAARATAARYVAAVEAQGAQAVRLLAGGAYSLAGLAGLLLAGGGDVDPCWYWERHHPLLGEVDPDRDQMEIFLAREAVAAGLPVLGICRGAQVIGVALGGKLVQDIGACVRGALLHTIHGNHVASHRVRVAEHCRLRQILGATEVVTNSYHHQANAELAPGLRAVAWSDDGLIEAIEGDGDGFLIGVQWHPERMMEDPAQARLFAAFVAEATAAGARGREAGARNGRETTE